jgi:hypothetical protein
VSHENTVPYKQKYNISPIQLHEFAFYNLMWSRRWGARIYSISLRNLKGGNEDEEMAIDWFDFSVVHFLWLCPDEWPKGPRRDDGWPTRSDDGARSDDEQYDGYDESNVRDDGEDVKFDEGYAGREYETDIGDHERHVTADDGYVQNDGERCGFRKGDEEFAGQNDADAEKGFRV